MDIQKLINEYTLWMKKEITFDKVGEYFEITTPYLDSMNDYLQIYVKQEGEKVYFTDGSATLHGLKAGGVQFTPDREKYLQKILSQYGVNLSGDELMASAPINDFARKKHLFIQAILRTEDLFSVCGTETPSFFLDNIQSFFAEKEIYFTDNVQFTGISGFSHNYDFLLQRSRTKPERLCQAVNNPNKSNMGNILFAWNDTKPARRNESQLIVILNDLNVAAGGIEEALNDHEMKVIFWTERDRPENLEMLSAV